MILKHLERRDASDFGLIVLELLLMLITFLRMSEMGEFFHVSRKHYKAFQLLIHIYHLQLQMGSFRSAGQSFTWLS